MRTLFFPAFLAVCACSDAERDDADIAADHGVSVGQGHAADAVTELFLDEEPTVAAKSGAIMMAIDGSELLLSDFVLAVSTDPVVLDFAENMFVTHANHMAAIADVLLALELSPIVSDASLALDREAERYHGVLRAAADVDYELMRQQITAHSEAFVIVETLVDIAPYTVLEAFFDDSLPVIDAHRAEALKILRNL